MSSRYNSNKDLLRYAGLATQIFVSLGIAVFIGIKADKWMALRFPVLSWALPLLVLVGLIIKLIKETSSKKNDKQDLE
jgi:undecaprenyl pyrophosphate phosphatase UppP